MKKILGLTIAALLVLGLVGGGTWAYFSDPETSTGNTFTAGTLNLIPLTEGTGPSGNYTVTAGGDGVNGKVEFVKMEPGDTGTTTWTLANNGNLPGTLTIASTITFSDVDDNEPEAAVSVPHANNGGTNGDLDEFVGVRLERGTGVDQAAAISAFSYILGTATSYAPFSALEAILDAQSQAMAASGGSDTIVYRLSWKIDTDVVGAGVNGTLYETSDNDDAAADDNIIQSDSGTADITFTLTQS